MTEIPPDGRHIFVTLYTIPGMATRTGTGLGQPNAESPDASYAIVAGLYVAVLLAPIAVLVLSRVTSNGGILYLGFLAAITGFATVTGWIVSRTSGLGQPGWTHRSMAARCPPVRWFIGVPSVVSIGPEPPGITVGLAIVSTIGGMFLGFFLTVMSRTRYAAAVLIGAEEFVEWEARWPRRWRRLSLGGMVVAGVVGVAGVIVQLVWSDWSWGGESLSPLLPVDTLRRGHKSTNLSRDRCGARCRISAPAASPAVV